MPRTDDLELVLSSRSTEEQLISEANVLNTTSFDLHELLNGCSQLESLRLALDFSTFDDPNCKISMYGRCADTRCSPGVLSSIILSGIHYIRLSFDRSVAVLLAAAAGAATAATVVKLIMVVYGNDDTTDGQLKQQIKLLSSYSLKALWFAMPMFYASLTHHYSTSTTFNVEDTLFLVAIIVDAALILLLSKWGNALVCISWLLLELATCLLILSFNKHYAFAILAALLLAIVVALLQPKLQHAADRHVLPFFTQDMIGDDEESPHLGHLLDLSQGIASFGGLFTAIAGRFMVGPINAAGFFFFCAIALGLYLSMVVTVGAVTRPHAKCLAIVVVVLVVLTFIAASIPLVGHSGSTPQVVT
ncbi:unnamed protein product [Miscanthus lutarioriparius]|uniref:Uncharacterized protein n=1 Tax=Miscanthus lutarioriparius TaxID=422564 RepID=A0A811QIB5_9POAL|nr:unnamed protein product [Miscanthus lutarioriparius]